MLRLRLVSLALASSLLLTLSGCCSMCEDGKLFPRLFPSVRAGSAPVMDGAECDCQRSGWPQGMPMPTGQGPFLMPGSASNPPTSIPITNLPVTQPPLFKNPSAPPTAYFPPAN